MVCRTFWSRISLSISMFHERRRHRFRKRKHTDDRYGRDKVRDFKSKIYKEIDFYIEAVTEPMTAPPRPPPQVLRSARQSQRRRRRYSIVKSKAISPTFVKRTHRRTKTDGDVYRHRVDSQALSSLRHFESDSGTQRTRDDQEGIFLFDVVS